jgi:hypothetical protein
VKWPASNIHAAGSETAKVRVDFVDQEYEDMIVALLETSRPEHYRAPCAEYTFVAGDIVSVELSE